jgi:hypothetical protein
MSNSHDVSYMLLDLLVGRKQRVLNVDVNQEM